VTVLTEFLKCLAAQDAVLVTVASHRGSVPREAGAWMAVFADHLMGTVGGGHLEWQAIQEARARLNGSVGAPELRYALGPTLGQCCGGDVHLRFEQVGAQDVPALAQRFDQQMTAWPVVALFGGGHVGRSLVGVLATLPLHLRWIDSRDEIFPPDLPAQVVCEFSQPVQAAVADLPAGALVLIMSFSHAEDLDVLAACLQRQRQHADLPYIGLIGSHTKWAVFGHRLKARGFTASELAHVTCPIGVAGISGKQPEVIAVAVAAQLLQVITHTLSGKD
jgi:xanthine dehydrogenase accessory factor